MSTTIIKTPWHLWVIGVVTLLWNGFGANDYTQTQLRNMEYLESMGYPPEGLAYIDNFPMWAEAGWAFGVWGAVLGSLLLLLRSRFSVLAYLVSIGGLALTTYYETITELPPELAEIQPGWFPLVLWSLALLQLWYAWIMRREHVLR